MRIDEWKALRDEIITLDSTCVSLLKEALLLSIALFGWFISQATKTPHLLLLLSPIWLLSYSYLFHKRMALRRASSYLRVEIENGDNVPKWETNLQKLRRVRPWYSKVNPDHIELLTSLGMHVAVGGGIYYWKLSAWWYTLPVCSGAINILQFLFMLRTNKNLDNLWKQALAKN